MKLSQQSIIVGLVLTNSFAVLVGIALAMHQTTSSQVSSSPANHPSVRSKLTASPNPTTFPDRAAIPEQSPPTPPVETPPAQPSLQPDAPAYARRPIELTDQAKPGSAFYEFRERLRQAVRDRDAAFIRQIADPQIQLTFGRPITIEELEIDNPQAIVWQHLERIINTGCTPHEAPAEAPVMDAWTCPHVAEASLGDPFTDIYIVGSSVNVRAEPKASSPVIAVLSHEVVQFDAKGAERLSDQQRQVMQTVEGWQPVITPEGKRGYVSSRYAYIPAGYRARFEQKQGAWKMTVFIAGD